MIQINLAAIANQSLNIRLDNRLYGITVKEAAGVMAIDLVRDNVMLLQGQRLVSGSPVIPYQYLESGNFVFITLNDEYPEYPQFGAGQFLLYASADEVLQLRELYDLSVADIVNSGLPVLPGYFYSVWDGGASIWDGGATRWRDLIS